MDYPPDWYCRDVGYEELDLEEGQVVNKPVKMKRNELAGIFKAIAASIEAGDSFEGNIAYSCLDDIFGLTDGHVEMDDLATGEFYIGGMYRVGNSMGQGGVNLLWEVEEDTPKECSYAEGLCNCDNGPTCKAPK